MFTSTLLALLATTGALASAIPMASSSAVAMPLAASTHHQPQQQQQQQQQPPQPSTTGHPIASKTSTTLTGVTHSVVAGFNGLHFEPANVVAQIGDVIEWHFLPKNHSVAQSSFAKPCVPDADLPVSFFSGFMPTAAGQADDVFQIVVQDDSTPIWYYCAQTVGSHCQMGMAGVINQDFSSGNTLDVYIANAAKTGTSVVPPVVGGGVVVENPNPLSGVN